MIVTDILLEVPSEDLQNGIYTQLRNIKIVSNRIFPKNWTSRRQPKKTKMFDVCIKSFLKNKQERHRQDKTYFFIACKKLECEDSKKVFIFFFRDFQKHHLTNLGENFLWFQW